MSRSTVDSLFNELAPLISHSRRLESELCSARAIGLPRLYFKFETDEKSRDEPPPGNLFGFLAGVSLGW